MIYFCSTQLNSYLEKKKFRCEATCFPGILQRQQKPVTVAGWDRIGIWKIALPGSFKSSACDGGFVGWHFEDNYCMQTSHLFEWLHSFLCTTGVSLFVNVHSRQMQRLLPLLLQSSGAYNRSKGSHRTLNTMEATGAESSQAGIRRMLTSGRRGIMIIGISSNLFLIMWDT